MRWLVVGVCLLTATALAAPGLSRMPDAPPPVPALPSDAPPEVVRGERLYRVAACVGCHSPPFRDAQHPAGGRDLPTAFGTFYAPNISPSPTTGIGTWAYDDFVRAMREGIGPDGRKYWPTFPYMAYTGMSDQDLADLWAYLRSQPAVEAQEPPHEILPRYRGLLGVWRMLSFREGRVVDDPTQSEAWNRGRYIVRAYGYCDQCHTPRTSTGMLVRKHDLAGGANPGKGEVHPNLTPDPNVGLGRWTEDDIVRFMLTGIKPNGEAADHQQVMAEKVADSFSYLGEDDARAVAVYLKALPPNDFDPATLVRPRR